MSLGVKQSTSLAVKQFMSLVVKRFTSLAVKWFMSLAVKQSTGLAVRQSTSLAEQASSGQSHKCRLTWHMEALYSARIFEFFVERLCSCLWSGSFSVFPPSHPLFFFHPLFHHCNGCLEWAGDHGWVTGICQPWGQYSI